MNLFHRKSQQQLAIGGIWYGGNFSQRCHFRKRTGYCRHSRVRLLSGSFGVFYWVFCYRFYIAAVVLQNESHIYLPVSGGAVWTGFLQNRCFVFIVSRTLGATARMYLVVNILQIFILDAMGVPFILTAFVMLLLILLYTFEGG